MKSIFISATSKDLTEHRTAVKAAIERLEQRSIDMANFGSQPGGAVGASLNEVRKADVFVGIIAHRYGYVPEGMDKSVTEQEYDEAVRRNIPRLMYLVDPQYKWPEESIENVELAQKRLAAFKARINANEVRSLFTTSDNLAQQVSADLTKQLKILVRRQHAIYAGIAAIIAIALIIAAILFSPDEEKTGIAQADRQATNNAIAAIAATETASEWTPTPTPAPERLGPGFNVVVAGFSFRTDDGQYIQNSEANDVTNIIAASLSEIEEIDNLLTWDDYGVGHILEADSTDRNNHAAQLAETFGADVVLYGTVSIDNVFAVVEPEFYVAAEFAALEPELIGADTFGTAVEFLRDSDDIESSSQDFQDRLLVLRIFLRGLSNYITGDFDASQKAFEDGLTIDEDGLEVLHIFAGNAALRKEDPGEAIDHYNVALSTRPSYSRALIGKGIALYTKARQIAGDNPRRYDQSFTLDTSQKCEDPELPDEAQLLGELALRCYEEASLSDDQPETADVDVKVAFGIGQVNVWMAIVGYSDVGWSKAHSSLTEVTKLYADSDQVRQSRIRAMAANANAWLGLRLLSIDGNNPSSVMEARDYYLEAISLLEQDANRSYNARWIEIYQEQVTALDTWLDTRGVQTVTPQGESS